MPTPTVQDDDYLTPPRISRITGRSLTVVRDWISSGELPAVDLSRGRERPRWYVKRRDLEAFIKARSNRK